MSPRRAEYSLSVSDTDCIVAGPLFEGHPAAHRALCDWLAQHGIDAHDVPDVCLIERRMNRRQVVVDIVMKRKDGRPVLLDGKLVTYPTEFQLEAPPLPFPAVLWEAIA